jgi:hypothetical protein
MSRRRTRIVLLAAAGVGIALLAWAPVAQASGILGSGIGPNLGPNGRSPFFGPPRVRVGGLDPVLVDTG